MDRYYNSLELAQILYEKGIIVLGTMRKDRYRNHLPPLSLKCPDRKQIVFFKSSVTEFICLVAYYEKSSKEVTVFITTSRNLTFDRIPSFFHNRRPDIIITDFNFTRHLQTNERPLIAHTYNCKMNGTDSYDQNLHSKQFVLKYRKIRLWYRNHILRMISLEIVNTFILWHPSANVRGDGTTFRHILCHTVLQFGTPTFF